MKRADNHQKQSEEAALVWSKMEYKKIVLDNCEICGKKLTDAEKEEHGNECQECVDHLKEMFDNAFKNGTANS